MAEREFDYQRLKEEYYRLARDAENNVRKDKLKAPKAPPVYEMSHDLSLARRDIYTFLATSHFSSKQDFIDALNKMLDISKKNSNAFDEQRYAKAYANYLKDLIVKHQ